MPVVIATRAKITVMWRAWRVYRFLYHYNG